MIKPAQEIKQLITGEDKQPYLPLANTIIEAAQPRPRLLTAIIGAPGSGKSSLAAILAELINEMSSSEIAIVVGLDGWHYPNEYLDSHFFIQGEEKFSLRKIKGAPESFDAITAINCLKHIKQGGEVTYPIYSRTLHNPIPNAGQMLPQHKIILCEGNYWLLNEPVWRDGIPLFDMRILIQIEPSSLIPALRSRHFNGGKSQEEVERQIEVDLQNGQRIIHNSAAVDIFFERENPSSSANNAINGYR